MNDAHAWGKPLPLTPRQLEALQVIFELLDVLGEAPTYAQIGVELGTTSKGTVARMLYALRDRGWIRLDHRRGTDRLILLSLPPVMPDFDAALELLPAGRSYVEAADRTPAETAPECPAPR